MKQTEVNRFNKLYQRHLMLLKLQGKSQKTIDAYSRSVRRIRDHFDCCPDKLTLEQLEAYFGDLADTHSWSTVWKNYYPLKIHADANTNYPFHRLSGVLKISKTELNTVGYSV